jgi:hypothetical protein
MTLSRHTRITAALACVAAFAVAAPGTATAKSKKRVHKAAAVPTIVINHKYDAGGNGADSYLPAAGQKVNLLDPLNVAIGLGNGALAQLGLPPVPAAPPLP